MPRLVAFLVTTFCACSAALLGFNATPKPLVHTMALPLVPVTVRAVVDPHVIIHDHVHEHRVVDRAKQLREAAAAYKMLAAYVAGLPAAPAEQLDSSATYVAPWPWSCAMRHESDLRTGSHWTFRNGAFEGAFAMAHSTYYEFAQRSTTTVTGQDGKQHSVSVASVYPHAYDAPPPVQVEVAINARAVIGSSEWGGLRACGG